MNSKAAVLATSTFLAVSILATVITVTKLSDNQTTAGEPVAAADFATPTVNPNAEVWEGELMETFTGFPVYSSAQVTYSSKEEKEDGSEFYSAVWTVGGDNVISEMASWYASELDFQGWQKVDEAGDGMLTQSQNFIRESESLSVEISKGDGKSRYKISIRAELLQR
jgi:hypothetical protein